MCSAGCLRCRTGRSIGATTTSKPSPIFRSSGAGAISIIADVDGASIRVGYDPADVETVETFWLPAAKARSIAARARNIAAELMPGPGNNPDADVADLVAAIRRAAAESRVTLTAYDVAIARARDAVRKLDGYFAAFKAGGRLSAFNREYRARRMAASARGAGFMSYAIAERRLKRAMVPLLAGGMSATRAGCSRRCSIVDLRKMRRTKPPGR
jgi:hypothetical protein